MRTRIKQLAIQPAPEEQKIRNAYKIVFGTGAGELVLADLQRIASSYSIDKHNPNPQSALYAIAQQDLINRIYNRIGDAND